ncbi:MAG: hypothetical protein CMP76_10050 [Flavobacterium sp.]|uniref:helix-turn-helix domain-containing protein n=2 Tax=unclassified Flavobacterium TaxID=196869 RepID=UPI000C4961F0|nr:helix-turn-helix domain-containing protein [Flavobacterium sp.]MBF03626.1 hypothetical protein [Flavobacterium sp.]
MKFSINLILLFLISNIYSQSKTLTNEDFEKLKLKIKLEIRNNLDSAYYYCDVIEKSNNYLHKSFSEGYKAYVYELKKDTLSSNEHLIKANNYLKKIKNSPLKYEIECQIINLSGLIDRNRNKYSDALQKFEKGKIIATENKDQKFILKFNNNLASLNADIQNYNLAINSLKDNNNLLNNSRQLYTENEFNKSKSLITYNIGNYYQDLYIRDKVLKDLDSAEYYFNETLLYTNNLLNDKIRAICDLASIKLFKREYKKAESYYNTANALANEKKFVNEQITIKYNLGYLNYIQKKYEKSLIYFREVDSISNLKKFYSEEFLKSNFYQGKIYYYLKNNEEGLKHLNIYSEEYKKYENNIINHAFKINTEISALDINKEVESLKKVIEKENLYTSLWKLIVVIILISLLLIAFKFYYEKNKANQKVEKLLNEFKANKTIDSSFNMDQKMVIDDDKEKEILEKLKTLIDNKYFLSQDFNQQNVAKKIKTNTTYLSQIVNKNFKKTFREYSNELKINYAIQELINNPTYRKYSTQAIAESVGFKNNVSFTKSFKKRAGVSPAQFIIKINNTQ